MCVCDLDSSNIDSSGEELAHIPGIFKPLIGI